MPKGPSAACLTGIWHGIYTYPIPRAPVSFVATLIETASAVSGTTHEPCAIGGGPNEMLYATLLGSRQHSAVAFVKIYDGANRVTERSPTRARSVPTGPRSRAAGLLRGTGQASSS
jgi:hypothetical protein